MSLNERRYSTGLPFLDRRIDGGLTAGGLLALTAPPQSQSELILRQLVYAQQTLYVSTTRPEAEVRTWAEAQPESNPELTVTRENPQDLLENLELLDSMVIPESFVVIDRANGLESASREEYLAFLDSLKAKLLEMESVGILHCSQTPSIPPQRGLTLDRVDQVWQLELMPLSREIKNRLLVTKSRNSRALREPIDILLTDRVEVDTSRRIG